jgi:hypothetical protein
MVTWYASPTSIARVVSSRSDRSYTSKRFFASSSFSNTIKLLGPYTILADIAEKAVSLAPHPLNARKQDMKAGITLHNVFIATILLFATLW